MTTPAPPRSRVRVGDLLPLGTVGLRSRPVRAALSMLGVAIGIAAVVAVLGITRSSQADLLARIDRLGTNLLAVTDGHSLAGQEVPLPSTAPATVARTDGVTASAATAELTTAAAYRSDLVPRQLTGGVAVRATGTDLLSTVDGTLARGCARPSPPTGRLRQLRPVELRLLARADAQ